MRLEEFYANGKSTDTSWDRTSDLPICSTVPYPLCYRGDKFKVTSKLQMLRTAGRDDKLMDCNVGTARGGNKGQMPPPIFFFLPTNIYIHIRIHTRCGNKETGLLLLLISGHVDDEEEGRALTRGLPSTVTQRFIHAHRLVWP